MIDINFELVDFSNVAAIYLDADGSIEIEYIEEFLPVPFIGD